MSLRPSGGFGTSGSGSGISPADLAAALQGKSDTTLVQSLVSIKADKAEVDAIAALIDMGREFHPTILPSRQPDGSVLVTFSDNSTHVIPAAAAPKISSLTQAQYDALPVKDPETYYFILRA